MELSVMERYYNLEAELSQESKTRKEGESYKKKSAD